MTRTKSEDIWISEEKIIGMKMPSIEIKVIYGEMRQQNNERPDSGATWIERGAQVLLAHTREKKKENGRRGERRHPKGVLVRTLILWWSQLNSFNRGKQAHRCQTDTLRSRDEGR